MPPMLLTYAAYALMPLCMLRKSPGTGPVIVATLATVTELSVMPTSRFPPVGVQPPSAWGGGASPVLGASTGAAPGSAATGWPGCAGAVVADFTATAAGPVWAGAACGAAAPRLFTAATWSR